MEGYIIYIQDHTGEKHDELPVLTEINMGVGTREKRMLSPRGTLKKGYVCRNLGVHKLIVWHKHSYL